MAIHCGSFFRVYPVYCLSVVPVSILYKSIAGRYRPVSLADGPIMARYRFIKNAYRGICIRTTSCGKRELNNCCFAFCWFVCTVCRSLFALPPGAIGRLCSVFVALPGHRLYYFGLFPIFLPFHMGQRHVRAFT